APPEGEQSMATFRAKRWSWWSWWIAPVCLLTATASVWAGNVSPTIQDTGTAVGIGTATPTPGYKFDVFNTQMLNSRADGLAGGLGSQQLSNYTTGSRVIFNLLADAFNDTGAIRPI